MHVWPSFNSSNGKVCPVCKTGKDAPSVLIPKPDTESDGIVECGQVHKKCWDLIQEMNQPDEDISQKLIDTALGATYHGQALRTAKGLHFLSKKECLVISRRINGNQQGTDHIALQDIALKIKQNG